MSQESQEEQFRKKLDPQRYAVLREKATEPPFSGKLLNNHENGDYLCAACHQVIFSSQTKFDSHSGWPSFFEPENRSAVILKEDNSLNNPRVEVCCAKCGSHLGHVFDDAYDQPGGKRYCINSLSLEFIKK
jgi:peptide-methionine (R)-S-oxide reductase